MDITVKDLWNALTPAEKEDACLAFWEGKDSLSTAAQPRVLKELAGAMKFREITVKRMPPREKGRFLRRHADSPSLRHDCGDILRSWMIGRKNAQLICFVEKLGLKHVGGILEDEAPAPGVDALKEGVRALLAAFPHREIALYLGLMLADGGDFWNGLAEAVGAEFPSIKDLLSPAA